MLKELDADHREDWLLRVEILECTHRFPGPPAWQAQLLADLRQRAASSGDQATCIQDGINLVTVA